MWLDFQLEKLCGRAPFSFPILLWPLWLFYGDTTKRYSSEKTKFYLSINSDPVGETAASSVRKAIGCSFTEVIGVSLAQVKEAEVSHFECPTCLAVRHIPPKGGHFKFPWHPKRTTNTPNQDLRWVKRGNIWGLSDKNI